MTKVRVGVVGCGIIAQIMHLPFLHELRERFEIAAVCDLSPSLVNYVGGKFGVHDRYTDHRELVTRTDIDAVAVLTVDHMPVALDAIDSGKHVFVEKPLAHNLDEADRIIEAARQKRVLLMVGYMKRYDPAFERALTYFDAMRDELQLIRMHLLGAARERRYPVQLEGVYTLEDYRDITTDVLERTNSRIEEGLRRAIASDDPVLLNAYRILLMVCCHDFNIVRAAFGEPQRVLFTDIYRGGDGIVSVFQYPNEVRCVWEVGGWLGPVGRPWWDEHLVAYGTRRTVKLTFPHSYLKYVPTMLYVRNSDGGAVVNSRIVTSYEEPFRREWLHFYECVVSGVAPRTSGTDARGDIALAIDVVKTFQRDPASIGYRETHMRGVVARPEGRP